MLFHTLLILFFSFFLIKRRFSNTFFRNKGVSSSPLLKAIVIHLHYKQNFWGRAIYINFLSQYNDYVEKAGSSRSMVPNQSFGLPLPRLLVMGFAPVWELMRRELGATCHFLVQAPCGWKPASSCHEARLPLWAAGWHHWRPKFQSSVWNGCFQMLFVLAFLKKGGGKKTEHVKVIEKNCCCWLDSVILQVLFQFRTIPEMLITLGWVCFFALLSTIISDASKRNNHSTSLWLYFDADNHVSWLSSWSLWEAANDSQ